MQVPLHAHYGAPRTSYSKEGHPRLAQPVVLARCGGGGDGEGRWWRLRLRMQPGSEPEFQVRTCATKPFALGAETPRVGSRNPSRWEQKPLALGAARQRVSPAFPVLFALATMSEAGS